MPTIFKHLGDSISPIPKKFRWWERKKNESCLHDKCPNCKGTGVQFDGTACVHMISCPCSKCSPRYY